MRAVLLLLSAVSTAAAGSSCAATFSPPPNHTTDHPPRKCTYPSRPTEDGGGWDARAAPILDTQLCTIPRVPYWETTRERFMAVYYERQPVILTGFHENIREGGFIDVCTRESLTTLYGNHTIRLSTANKNSYLKKDVSLREYVEEMMSERPVVQYGNTTWYHFGNNDHAAWPELFECYVTPEKFMKDRKHYAFSFGLGASGSGVPFHTHGGVFNEVVYGRKRWWLQAPGPEPAFHPDESAMQWLFTHYPAVEQECGSDAGCDILECVVGPGEIIYIPGMWHHSTLNIGQTVFMATFV